MTKKIYCKQEDRAEARAVKVRIIKAPLVDSEVLKSIVFNRARAIVL
jgi:hypothetical protein